MNKKDQDKHVQVAYEVALGKKIQKLEAKYERLREAARQVLSADMAGVRDIDALNELEDAAGLHQQN